MAWWHVAACIFCDIRDGKVPAHVVGQDDDTIAFLDQRPLFPGHVLVIPRLHHETLMDLPPELVAPLFVAVRRMSAAVKDAMHADGVFVANNNIVSQSVPHLHVHVVPRKRKDGLRGFFWPRGKYGGNEPNDVADAIREAVHRLGA
ncbi:MAG: HIT family protein [Actinobacteria bacterium]|nr:HIT family protein [Actinomycetota bacterium]